MTSPMPTASLAPYLAALRRRRHGAPAPSARDGGRPGVAFLPEAPDARVSVEIAFGADLTADAGTWAWTDVTLDVRASPGLAARLGRNDESSETNPAELSLVLTNTSGDYSQSGRSRRYPYIRRGTPVRARIDPGTGPRVVVQGNATGWAPGWDALTGKIPVVTLTASGALRRIGQGTDPIISPIRRYLVAEPNCVAYWPCEVGANAQTFPAAVGSRPMWWTGTASLASCSDFTASNPLPTMNGVSGIGGSFRAALDTYTVGSDSSQGVRALFSFPAAASAPADSSVLMKVFLAGGSIGRFELLYRTGGSLGVIVYDKAGGILGSSNPVAFLVDGKRRLLSLEFFQTGGTTFYGLNSLQVGETFYTSIGGGPSVTGTLGIVSEIWIDPSAAITGVGFGHIAVLNSRSATDPLTDVYKQLNGYPAELPTTRIARLGTENKTPVTVIDGTADVATFADAMGAQPISDVLTLMRECETVERGVLWDGTGAGLTYTARRTFESASPAFTIDAAALELAAPFAPTDDDQRLRNRWTVGRTGGATFTVEDTTGELGTAVVGIYPDSKTVNAYADRGARDIADWLLSQGIASGYRYPSITIDLRAVPRLLGPCLDLAPGSRIDIANVSSVLTSGMPGTVGLTVEGIAWTVTPYGECTVTLNCSPARVWAVAALAADAGDTSANLAVLDAAPGDSAVATFAAAGSTSLVVSTVTLGALWTTVADDFPLTLNVGGESVRATACSGASSPQTFTVDPLAVDRHVADQVTVWNPPGLGL